jgi:hypothetical protein
MDIAFGTHILDLEREEIENVHHRETHRIYPKYVQNCIFPKYILLARSCRILHRRARDNPRRGRNLHRRGRNSGRAAHCRPSSDLPGRVRLDASAGGCLSSVSWDRERFAVKHSAYTSRNV